MTRISREALASIISLLLLVSIVFCAHAAPPAPYEQTTAEELALFPELFGVSLAGDNDNRHSALTFSPDGLELFYSVYTDNQHPQKIFFSKRVNGAWSEPSVAPFSGTYKDGGPLFSPDGNRVYFYSKRPSAPEKDANEDYDIWYVQRLNNDWSEAIHLDENINTADDESTNTFSTNGDFYFNRRTADSQNFLFKTALVGDSFKESESIKELTNQEEFFKPVPIEGEDFFIFTNNTQKGRFYYAALYISYKNEDGSWTRPKDMGDMINFGEGRFPSLSADRQALFFTSYRTGISQFYRVDARVIDYLKTEDLDLIRQLKLIVVDTSIETMKSAYEALTQKHAMYYRFDKTLFNEVAGELVADDAITKAIDVYKLNFELYPTQKFYAQRLIVSLLKDSEGDFTTISTMVENGTIESHRELLDEFNVAGEVFLQKGRADDAIRIFKLNARINPTSTWPSYKLGKAYYQLEDFEAARTYFNKALELNPDNIYAKNYLEELRFPILAGPYLGQKPPGMKPEKFASGVLSVDDGDTINSVFSPDGNEFYYVFLEDQSPRYNLWFTKIEDGTWSRPKPLLASDKYSVADIALSPDGNRLYFCSDMPTFWEDAEGFDIWYIERTGDGWSEPVNAGKQINSPGGETQPSFTTDGTMYFPSWHDDSQTGSVDIYYSKFIEGEFSKPIPLPDSVNSQYNEGNSFVAPDGSFILFARWDMPKSIDGGKGLYISFRNPDKSWTEAVNTAQVLGIRGSLAALTHDGKYLLWSTRKGIHWVDVRILDQLKPTGLR